MNTKKIFKTYNNYNDYDNYDNIDNNEYIKKQTDLLIINSKDFITEKSKSKEDYYEMLGIQGNITNPFHFYFRISDIEKNKQNINFSIYSAGIHKLIIWGILNIKTEKIEIYNSCKYNLKNLSKYLDHWKQENFKLSGVLMKDYTYEYGFIKTLNSIKNYSDYINLKFYLSSQEISKFFENSSLIEHVEGKYLMFIYDLYYENIFLLEDLLYDVNLELDKILEIGEEIDKEEYEIIKLLEDDINKYELLYMNKHQILINDLKKYNKILDNYFSSNKYSSDYFYSIQQKCPDENDCFENSTELCDIFKPQKKYIDNLLNFK